jgi:CheY-like chemotaxis protein
MLLRMRAVDMVEDAGYTSVEAVDADAAFAILESRSDIALLFTDIQMPRSRCSPLGLLHRPRQLNARASRRGAGKWHPRSRRQELLAFRASGHSGPRPW